jgi:predicted dithiol-disulfide oxidoreductase (DUF899 family)
MLAELFDGRSQLVVYHFMFAPEDDEGCLHCSFWADSFDANVVHLNARDVTMVAVSRAPFDKLRPTASGWAGASNGSHRRGTAFNSDLRVSFTPEEASEAVYNFGTMSPGFSDREGVSVFYKDESGKVFHTYSTYARGIDILNAAYNYLDLVPKGRGEEEGPPQFWVRRRDEYAR